MDNISEQEKERLKEPLNAAYTEAGGVQVVLQQARRAIDNDNNGSAKRHVQTAIKGLHETLGKLQEWLDEVE